MSSVIFAKLKSLFPISIIGFCVAITIKLLTSQTPSLQESFNVDIEEDIQKVHYQDEIVPPKEEEKVEETLEESEVEVEEELESAEEETPKPEDSSKDSEQEAKEQEERQKEEKSQKRKWKNEPNNPILGIIQKLTKAKK